MSVGGLHILKILGYTVIPAVVLFLLLRKLGVRTLQVRIRDAKSHLDDLEEKKRNLEEDLAQYHKRLSLLDKEAEKVAEVYERQGNQVKTNILALTADAAEKLETHARKHIRQALEKEKENLKREVVKSALTMTENEMSVDIKGNHRDKPSNDNIKKVVAS